MNPWEEPTIDQCRYVDALKAKLRLTTPLLDAQCDRMFRKPFRELTKGETSRLIDTLKGWEQLPAELARLQGQMDLLEGVP